MKLENKGPDRGRDRSLRHAGIFFFLSPVMPGLMLENLPAVLVIKENLQVKFAPYIFFLLMQRLFKLSGTRVKTQRPPIVIHFTKTIL